MTNTPQELGRTPSAPSTDDNNDHDTPNRCSVHGCTICVARDAIEFASCLRGEIALLVEIDRHELAIARSRLASMPASDFLPSCLDLNELQVLAKDPRSPIRHAAKRLRRSYRAYFDLRGLATHAVFTAEPSDSRKLYVLFRIGMGTAGDRLVNMSAERLEHRLDLRVREVCALDGEFADDITRARSKRDFDQMMAMLRERFPHILRNR